MSLDFSGISAQRITAAAAAHNMSPRPVVGQAEHTLFEGWAGGFLTIVTLVAPLCHDQIPKLEAPGLQVFLACTSAGTPRIQE